MSKDYPLIDHDTLCMSGYWTLVALELAAH